MIETGWPSTSIVTESPILPQAYDKAPYVLLDLQPHGLCSTHPDADVVSEPGDNTKTEVGICQEGVSEVYSLLFLHVSILNHERARISSE